MDPRALAKSILSKRKASGVRASTAPQKPEAQDAEVDGRHLAAQDILTASREGSAQKLTTALGHFFDMHAPRNPGDS